jgi:hypothetical protein
MRSIPKGKYLSGDSPGCVFDVMEMDITGNVKRRAKLNDNIEQFAGDIVGSGDIE